MKVLVFCSFDSLPSELIVIAHDNDRLSGYRGNLWGATIEFTNKLVVSLLY